jgi:alkanesulfonate monooxygenase
VFRGLTGGETVNFAGRHFTIDAMKLRPAGRYRARPMIYAGGESEPARQLAADLADVWFMNGQSLENVAALIADMRRRARSGEALRYGMSAFVIARETDAEAGAAHAAALELARQDAPLLARTLAAADAANVMFKPLGAGEMPQVGTNGGTAAGLVGCYDTVAARVGAFSAAGVELFMLQFQPFEAEMRRFAAEVIPRVRAM